MIISLFLSKALAGILFDIFLKEYDGYFPMYVQESKYPLILLLNIAAYALVAIIDYSRIKKIPMTDALKNVE
jgi:putative ABC transport system permease protein